MNLKEAKEHLEKIGYKVQRLNECGYYSACGSSGCGSSAGTYGCGTTYFSCGGHTGAGAPVEDRPSRIRRSSKRRTADTLGGLKNISSLLGDAPQAPRPNADATIQDLLDKIPPGKKELVIQLLKVLLAG